MSMNEILVELRGFPGVLEIAPQPGSDFPEVGWGDHFFYYAPGGTVPRNRQPYATIVTKNYPGDAASRLDAPDRWRLNIHAGSALFAELIGYAPDRIDSAAVDFSAVDVFLPHPLYGPYGWVAIVNPGPRTSPRALSALREAHAADRRRVERRSASS
ncbi:DUF6194 family protein [Amycolatopsis sp. GM8]|uniref:DUF6194 family protein n=1 Tax=Amycolatopsis sp. GM8 TaxID=2896530 RepID=UPI001F42FAFD|nr:DUF6194 family protein [Amycolatopsis sp. GM8]